MSNLPAMPDSTDNASELFETYDAAGKPLGVERRSVVHTSGIWHRAVNVVLFRSNGDFVLQQRAAGKRVCPLAWDLSVAEHLQVGESWQAAAARGLKEELGVQDATLTPCGPELQERHEEPANNIYNYEFQRCFSGVSDQNLRLQSTEVADTREVPLAAFVSEAESNPQRFTPWLLAWAEALGWFDTEGSPL